MCIWATKQKTRHRESSFYGEMAIEWDFVSSSEIMDMWGNVLRVLKVYTRGMVMGKKCRKKIAGVL